MVCGVTFDETRVRVTKVLPVRELPPRMCSQTRQIRRPWLAGGEGTLERVMGPCVNSCVWTGLRGGCGFSVRSLSCSPGVSARPVRRVLHIPPQECLSHACNYTGYAMGQSPLSCGAVEYFRPGAPAVWIAS